MWAGAQRPRETTLGKCQKPKAKQLAKAKSEKHDTDHYTADGLCLSFLGLFLFSFSLFVWQLAFGFS